MGQEVQGTIKSFKAASGSVPAYRIVGIDTNGRLSVHATATSFILGVSINDASATNDAVGVCMNGTARVMCGDSVSVGGILIPQTDTGKAIAIGTVSAQVTSMTGSVIARSIGIALQNGETNSVIEVAIMPNNIRMSI